MRVDQNKSYVAAALLASATILVSAADIKGGKRYGSVRGVSQRRHLLSSNLFNALSSNNPDDWTSQGCPVSKSDADDGEECTIPSGFKYQECVYDRNTPSPIVCVCQESQPVFICHDEIAPVAPVQAPVLAPTPVAPPPSGGSGGSDSCPADFPGDGTFCQNELAAAGNPSNLKCTFPGVTVQTPSGSTATAVCDCKNLGPNGPFPVWSCNGTVESNPAAAPANPPTGGSCPATVAEATGDCCDSLPAAPGPGVEGSCQYGATVCECPGQLDPVTLISYCKTDGWKCMEL